MTFLMSGRTGSTERLPVLDPIIPPLAVHYYKGLPGPFEMPTSPEAYTISNELRVLGDHHLAYIWEDDLAFKLHCILNSMNINWTSTDVVRIANVEDTSGPVVIWIGVELGTLGFDDGSAVVLECREVLDTYHIQGVNIEIRESRIIRPAGRRFVSKLTLHLMVATPQAS
jgi:hypothetical protein